MTNGIGEGHGGRHAIRKKPWGWEYRTPACFIWSAPLTRAFLALGKAVVFEEVNNLPLRLARLRGDFLQVVKVDPDRFNHHDRQYFLNKWDTLWKLIPLYGYWKTPEGRGLWRDVVALKRLAKYDCWNNGKDLLERWKLVSRTPTAKKKKKSELYVPAGTIEATPLWRTILEAEL